MQFRLGLGQRSVSQVREDKAGVQYWLRRKALQEAKACGEAQELCRNRQGRFVVANSQTPEMPDTGVRLLEHPRFRTAWQGPSEMRFEDTLLRKLPQDGALFTFSWGGVSWGIQSVPRGRMLGGFADDAAMLGRAVCG